MILEIYENCTDSVHAITESAWSSGTGSITELSSATNQTQCWWCSYQWFIGDEWMWTVKFSVHRIQTWALFFWCVTERALYKYLLLFILFLFCVIHCSDIERNGQGFQWIAAFPHWWDIWLWVIIFLKFWMFAFDRSLQCIFEYYT